MRQFNFLERVLSWKNRFGGAKRGDVDLPPALRNAGMEGEGEMYRELSLEKIREAFCLAKSGDVLQQVLAIQHVMQRDPAVAAHLQTRVLSVVGKSWSVTSRKYPELAECATEMLSQMNIQGLIRHLSYSFLWGYAGAVLDWAEGGERVCGFRAIQPCNFMFDEGGNPALLDAMGEPHVLDAFAPNQILVLKNESPHSIPSQNGIGVSLLWAYLLKQSGITGWKQFVERFGVPMFLGHLPSDVDQEQATAFLNSMNKMSKSGVGVTVGEEACVKVIEPSQKGNTHEIFCRYVDELLTLLILGQRASSAKGSGLSRGDLQGQVRQDLIAADASSIINVIQTQLLNPWLSYAFNLEVGAHDITFWIDYMPPEDLSTKATLCQAVANATGRTVNKAWAEQFFGVVLD